MATLITNLDYFRYASDLPLDLGFVHRQSDAKTPILLLYDEESSTLESLVRDMAGKKQVLPYCCYVERAYYVDIS